MTLSLSRETRGAALTSRPASSMLGMRLAHGDGSKLVLTSIFLAESVLPAGRATAPT